MLVPPSCASRKRFRLIDSVIQCLNLVVVLRQSVLNLGAGVWVGAQVDPLVVFVDVVSELGWG